MACETKDTKIGDHKLTVTQWQIMVALRMKMRLAKIIGPAMSSLSRISTTNGNDALEEAIVEGLGAIFSSTDVDEEIITTFIKDCFTSGGVRIDGASVDDAKFIEMFSGGQGMVLLYRMLGFIIKVNYGDLMGGLGQLAAVDGTNGTTEENTQT